MHVSGTSVKSFSMTMLASVLGIAGAAMFGGEEKLEVRGDQQLQQERPSIVLIFADDLGYGDLSAYGHPTIHTPQLDRMAEEGIKLTSFYVSSPACSPSRFALLTGRYPIRANLRWALGPEESWSLPDSELTLAEALKTQGYRTAAIGKWHLGSWPGSFPTEHGFDSYFGLLYSNDMMPPWVQTERPLELWRDTLAIEYPVDQNTLTERYTEEAIRFIREAGDEPFFVYLAHSMPHVPLHTSERFRGRSAGGLYGDVIETIDWSAGRILDVLEEEGLDERTLVIFTSDNGPWSEMPERMFREGRIQPWDAGTAGPLRGSKATTWEGGVRVPFIARWPGRIPAGRVGAEMATTMDLYTTLLGLAGAEPPADRALDGLDVWPFLTGRAGSPREYFYYVYPDRLEAVRDRAWKLVVRRSESEQAAIFELYDLRVDPYERWDVAAAHPDVVERLKERMIAFAAETGAQLASDIR
ncbi:MAG: sulfatase [Gemmatimonadales bacterium]|jgi:arylsulfatase A-like enzyme